MATVSFAPVKKDEPKNVTPAAGSEPAAASSAPATPANAEVVNKAPTADVSAALAPRPASAVATQHERPTYGGEDDTDIGDIRFPRLNLVQKSSAAALLKLGLGQFVLNKELALGEKLKCIVVGFSPKRYIEKTKYTPGANSNAKIVDSLQAVAEAGGTTSWFESKENPKAQSALAWYQPSVTALLVVEKPEGVAEDRFTKVVTVDGVTKCYGVALYSVKSLGYDAFFIKLNSEQKTGILREGFPTRFVEVVSTLVPGKSGESFQPHVKVLEKVPAELLEFAYSLRG